MRVVILFTSLLVVATGCKKDSPKPVSKEVTLELEKSQVAWNPGSYGVYATATFTVGGKEVAVGQVRINDTLVNYNTTNFYLDNLHVVEPYWNGYVDGTNTWSYTGDEANQLPAFDVVGLSGFSSIYKTTFDESLSTIDRSTPLTVNWNNTVPCDSIQVYIHDRVNGADLSSGFFGGNVSSYTFKPEQLSKLNPFDPATAGGANYSFIVIAGINYGYASKDDLKIKMKNESDFSQLVGVK